MSDYGVIIVGGGHAGAEAAAASARLGVPTALITHKFSTIGEMSCNPAIGGLGKGHLVREIDALDGIMGRIADKGGIQFRVLNRRKGPAVRGPRAQQDRKLYREAMQAELSQTPNLDIIEGEVDDLIVTDGAVRGVVLLDGRRFGAGAVVLTTGTFLRGLIHQGLETIPAGRAGEKPVLGLSLRLEALGLKLGRLKTGTPARLDANSIDFSVLAPQHGDATPEPFSALTEAITTPQITCFETRTTPEVHRIIGENLSRSAMYSGRIQSRGPRYCPSIEDKIVRFSDKDSHLVFLESEGLDDSTIYPNGVSTSLPEDVQIAFLRAMPGLENVVIKRAGYAIEYDHVDPRELAPSLMLRALPGLYLAGQINGTTGYEEAAAQGLLAGANAALAVQGRDPMILSRTNSYIGVMIDDLISRGVTEPYRMFTSRAEFRLHLRVDNADQRLTPLGIAIGLVGEARRAHFEDRMERLTDGRSLLASLSATPTQARKAGVNVNADGVRRSAFELMSYPAVERSDIEAIWPEISHIEPKTYDQLAIDAQYAVYLERQKADVEAVQRDESRAIPDWLDYSALPGLSNEMKQKLIAARPQTIAQAQRIEGVTPAALTLILAVIRRGRLERKASLMDQNIRESHIAAYDGQIGRSPSGILDDLNAYMQLMQRWQTVQNLVSRETPGDLWQRHIIDSLQLLPLIGPDDGLIRVLDIGSGGGFPALPLAIALKGRPFTMQLIESNSRKCAFLRAAAREFDLPITVHTARIEAIDPQSIGVIDIFTSRALAPLSLLLSYLSRFWSPQSRALLHKGREFGEEMKSADSDWVYDVLKHPSATDGEAVILEITGLQPRGKLSI